MSSPLFVFIQPAGKFKRSQKYKLPLSCIFGRNYHDTLWKVHSALAEISTQALRYLFLEAIKNAASRGHISYRRANWVTLKSNAGFIACEGNISKEQREGKRYGRIGEIFTHVILVTFLTIALGNFNPASPAPLIYKKERRFDRRFATQKVRRRTSEKQGGGTDRSNS